MIKFMSDIRDKTGFIAPELDIGGGLGIRYRDDRRHRSKLCGMRCWGCRNMRWSTIRCRNPVGAGALHCGGGRYNPYTVGLSKMCGDQAFCPLTEG